MSKIFYDIFPPKRKKGKFIMNLRKIKIGMNQSIFALTKFPVLKMGAFLLIIAFVWNGLSAVTETSSYYNDTEESRVNDFTAGILDFELSSAQVFSNAVLSPGSSVTGTISIINLDNIPKYKLKTDNFSGGLCDYLNLEANLDGGDVEYSGKLTEIDYGPVVFESPDDWSFILSLPGDIPGDLIGETCNFNFVFYGSQVRNDLLFGQGFSDTEDATNNIKAKMCFDSETRSKGYWKNHLDVVKPYLPQMLGNEIVSNTSDVYKILKTDYSNSMRNKLKGQLLAMKFNVAHYSMGEYIPDGDTRTVNQIIVEADNLLKQDPIPPDSVLEQMKDLLDGLNQDLQIRVCTETGVKVLIPNGGEKWWVGKYYDLTWTTKNLGCPNDLSYITIWYSKDSGDTWGNITPSTDNNGVYSWRLPLFLEGNTYYTPSDKARIKVVAVCSENLMVAGWDMSDADFCPPIDYDLLLPEEIEALRTMGLLPQEELIKELEVPEIIPEETSTTSEEVSTTTEEIFRGGFGGTAVSTDETIIAPEETSTEETPVEELAIEETLTEEPPIIEEPSVIENNPVEEQVLIDQTPAIEQEIIITPQDSPSVQSGSGDGGDTADNTAPEESAPAENVTR